MFHPAIRGFGWRRRAGRLIGDKLDEIFPGHGIAASSPVADLSIGRRQMVEIARAFTVVAEPRPPRDPGRADLLARCRHGRRSCWPTCAARWRAGISCVLISHILGEVLQACDRIVVMRDGRVVRAGPRPDFDRATAGGAMGGVEGETPRAIAARRRRDDAGPGADAVRPRARRDRTGRARRRDRRPGRARRSWPDRAAAGGLRRRRAPARGRRDAQVALVAGDRQADGVFPQWSIARNIGVRSLGALRAGPLISPRREQALAEQWRRPDRHPHPRRGRSTS